MLRGSLIDQRKTTEDPAITRHRHRETRVSVTSARRGKARQAQDKTRIDVECLSKSKQNMTCWVESKVKNRLNECLFNSLEIPFGRVEKPADERVTRFVDYLVDVYISEETQYPPEV
ncbi:MULE domain-containing protein [Aphis craccivora]|uniref:MULE domain-containing protein n=1 Tax=Aphis craccivora TaxID=307492 RepID=A0A6G0YNH8_APHCR|nr:MULE domain-containing protein [Aphis craccivora]